MSDKQSAKDCSVETCCGIVVQHTLEGGYRCVRHRIVIPGTKEPVGEVIGRKDDFGKTRFDLLPWRALEEVAKVLTKGAEKYAPENWRQVAGWRWRYFRAAIGHVAKWRMGEKLDPEWGLPHLAHAACCILFMIELDT